MTDTRGEGVMSAVFDHYEPYKGDIPHRNVGALVCHRERATPSCYGLFYAQDRGTLFCRRRAPPVYTGMIVGQNARPGDIDVNVCKPEAPDLHPQRRRR